MKKEYIFHPFLLAIYPTLFLFTHNMAEVPLKELAAPLIVAMTVVLLSWGLINTFSKNVRLSAMLVSVCLVFFFSYGHVNEYIKMIAIIWPGLLIILVYLLVKKREKLHGITRFMNAISVIVIVISIIQAGMFQLKKGAVSQNIGEAQTADALPVMNKEVESRPNILFIILDAYARADVLKEVYGYDNAAGFCWKQTY